MLTNEEVNSDPVYKTISDLVRNFFESNTQSEFIPGESRVPLMIPSYSFEEVNQVIESLLSTQITLNQFVSSKVQQFESLWSGYIGSKNGVMVNSGSSANLIALFILSNPEIKNHIEPGDEVITPATTWHTTVSPIISVGAVPVLIDVNLDDCNINVDLIEKEIGPKTKAIMPVHLLGNPCQMDKISELADKYNLFVIEDTCESHGSEFGGKKCGSLGDIGTFSFFFSHHLTTMEGGMVVTDNEEYAEIARIMRSQGVIRNTKNQDKLATHYRSNPDYDDIDMSFLFANIGFNLRPTEINGGFGIEQFKKFPKFLDQRKKNGEFMQQNLKKYEDFFHLPKSSNDGKAWFCYPLIVREDAPFSRSEIVSYLNSRKIETRPIMAGNVSKQPAMKLFKYKTGSLHNSDIIHKNGFFWGNHQGIRSPHRDYITECVDSFMKKYV